MGWPQWILVTFASSAAVGLIARQLTSSAIKHAFEVNLEKVKAQQGEELEKVKAQYAQELERMKAEMDANSKKELEYVKAEISLFANNAASDADREKALYMTVANIRAVSYPKLVSLLRRMKRQFEGLAFATNASQGGAVNLGGKTKRAELVRNAIQELVQLEKEFDDELSSVRLFTTRSDYYLQQRVKQFCDKWQNRNEMFDVSDGFLTGVIADYNDDISFLADEFYKPEIAIPQSGERLQNITILAPTSGSFEATAAKFEAVSAKRAAPKPTFEEWLLSRRPGSRNPHDADSA